MTDTPPFLGIRIVMSSAGVMGHVSGETLLCVLSDLVHLLSATRASKRARNTHKHVKLFRS